MVEIYMDRDTRLDSIRTRNLSDNSYNITLEVDSIYDKKDDWN